MINLDLYGRGYSEAPDTIYNHDLYTTQLALLLQHIRWDSTHIVGLSMVRFYLAHTDPLSDTPFN